MIVVFKQHPNHRFERDPEGRTLHWTAQETNGSPGNFAYLFWAADRDHAITTLAQELFSEDDDDPMDRAAARALFDAGGFVVEWLD